MPKREVVITPPLFLDRDSAAAALGISVRTLEGLVRSGDLPQPRKLSAGRVCWLWRELQEFAESRPVSDLQPGPGRKESQGADLAAGDRGTEGGQNGKLRRKPR